MESLTPACSPPASNVITQYYLIKVHRVLSEWFLHNCSSPVLPRALLRLGLIGWGEECYHEAVIGPEIPLLWMRRVMHTHMDVPYNHPIFSL
jgi:hypothetical protein